MKENFIIKAASTTDIQGIIKLQSENQASQGGTLSGELNLVQIQEMMKDTPQIIAIVNNEIVGFLMTTSQNVHKKRNVPIVDAMFESYSGNEDSYIYGPICVSQSQRGKGLAQIMFQELLNQVPNREGILFIRSDNEPSLRAHIKMGMKKISRFNFNNTEFYVFAYSFANHGRDEI